MMNGQSISPITQGQQSQLLKLITRSFCRELANLGIEGKDIVAVSIEILDYALEQSRNGNTNPVPAASAMGLAEIEPLDGGGLRYKTVQILPLQPAHLPTVHRWLTTTDVQQNFVVPYPADRDELYRYFLETRDRLYFAVNKADTFVGIIGGEQIKVACKKLEMKKFIGDPAFRRQGVGQYATLLWLYHVFHRMHFNKVYLHTLDTNVGNLNLNQKFGFEVEGVMFQDYLSERGYRDVLRMGLLKSSWQALFSSTTVQDLDFSA